MDSGQWTLDTRLRVVVITRLWTQDTGLKLSAVVVSNLSIVTPKSLELDSRH